MNRGNSIHSPSDMYNRDGIFTVLVHGRITLTSRSLFQSDSNLQDSVIKPPLFISNSKFENFSSDPNTLNHFVCVKATNPSLECRDLNALRLEFLALASVP